MDVAIGGDFNVQSVSGGPLDLRLLRSGVNEFDSNFNSYRSEIQISLGSEQFIASNALCFDNPPLRP